MRHRNSDEDFEWSALNHLLRYYKMEGVFHRVFFHDHEIVRYNMVIKEIGEKGEKIYTTQKEMQK